MTSDLHLAEPEHEAFVLIIEDDLKMRRFLRSALESEGHRVQEARTVDSAQRAIVRVRPEAILLDLGLSDGHGIDLVQDLRTRSDVPVIVLSVRGDDDHKIRALDAGADDYVTKPFSVGELLARLRAALRRARGRARGVMPHQIVTIGAIRIDVARREVLVGDRRVHLTPIEFQMLSILARAGGRIVKVEALMRELWPHDESEPSRLRVHMSSLRRKIEDDPTDPRRILTMFGVGYRLDDELEAKAP